MKKIFPIVQLTMAFAQTYRANSYRPGHFENDAEHSYQLAMACWAANEQYQLGLKDELLFKFALTHDLVEVFAGDTDAHGSAENLIAKEEKEADAYQKLRDQYGDFKDMQAAISEYEPKSSPEAQFVNLMDKLIPTLAVPHATLDYYRTRKITVAIWRQWLLTKVKYEILPDFLKNFVAQALDDIEAECGHCFYRDKE
jgi:5'-deoxynucleotidase YfbR-like HD superfamily hydrolase